VDAFFALLLGSLVAAFLVAAALLVVARSVIVIGPAQVGLVVKRVSARHNTTDTPVAFAGEVQKSHGIRVSAQATHPTAARTRCPSSQRRSLVISSLKSVEGLAVESY